MSNREERKKYRASKKYHDEHGNTASTIAMCESRSLRNRRILAALLDDGSAAFYFKKLQKDGRISVESIRLSAEAVSEMNAMVEAMVRFDKARSHEPKGE